jgi:hypothetical protein
MMLSERRERKIETENKKPKVSKKKKKYDIFSVSKKSPELEKPFDPDPKHWYIGMASFPGLQAQSISLMMRYSSSHPSRCGAVMSTGRGVSISPLHWTTYTATDRRTQYGEDENGVSYALSFHLWLCLLLPFFSFIAIVILKLYSQSILVVHSLGE